jgi:hypothetical protein
MIEGPVIPVQARALGNRDINQEIWKRLEREYCSW